MVMSNPDEGDSFTSVMVTDVNRQRITIAQYVHERVAERLHIALEKVNDDLFLSDADAHVIAFDLENIAEFSRGEIEDSLPGDPRIKVGDIVRLGIAAYRKYRDAQPKWYYPLPG